MTIRRQYSLPNCTLILEGLSDSIYPTGQPDTQPLMSILINAQCHFVGKGQPTVTGGREFFESLVTAVSSYAQESLSGVHRPAANNDKPSVVFLEKGPAEHLHRLKVQPSTDSDAAPNGANVGQPSAIAQATQIDLTTVQLFDLVEALDQFQADSRTLPDISLHLSPVSKRYVVASQPLARRAAPAAVGATSLAACALALYLVPVPSVKPPKPATPQPKSTATPTPSPKSEPSPKKPAKPMAAATPKLEAVLSEAPEITDPTEVRFLQRRLYNKIYQPWSAKPLVGSTLVYRVGVGKNGAILGYKSLNKAASDRVKGTPLPKLVNIALTDQNSTINQPLAQFKVVFTDKGIPEVSPWNGYTGKPGLGPQITDARKLSSLKQQLNQQIRPNWQKTPSYTEKLIYRVAVDSSGALADYEAYNQSAFDYVKETPLPSLLKPSDSDTVVPQEPLAQFKVIFQPNKALEISYWR